MVTKLERFIMHIQGITSPFKISPLVEYNGKLKLAFHQKNGHLQFILNYHFNDQKIIADVDFYFYDLKNRCIDDEMKKTLVKILLVFFEDGNHQAINCNLKLTSLNEYTNEISLFSFDDLVIWENIWNRVGYETATKVTEFQTNNNLVYASKSSVIWRTNRSLEGELFYFFFQQTTAYSFEHVYIIQLSFQENSIELKFQIGEYIGELIFYVVNNKIISKDIINQKELYSCRDIIEFNSWLQQYFSNQSLEITNNMIARSIIYTKKLLQRCIGEIPNDKLQFFANLCYEYLSLNFPDDDIEKYIEENLETIEIYQINDSIVAFTYKKYLLCISKTSNLIWSSQNNLEFNLIENK